MKKIIINCDDFGLDSKTNKAIIELIQNKKISSTTILVKRNPSACHEALLFAKAHSHVASFGLHLDLDEYFKFDELGLWGKNENHIISNYNEIFNQNKEKIMGDIENQFAIFKTYDVQISHVDGHHHIHLFPIILVELIPLMKKYHVNKMRFRSDFYLTRENLQSIESLLAKHHILVPDNFIDHLDFTDESGPIQGVNEIMSHVFFGTKSGLTHAQKLLNENSFNNYELINFNQL